MARIIKNSDETIISCIVTTVFEDDTTSDREFKVGDIVEGLRYVKDEEVKTVSGRVTAINLSITKVTSINSLDPKDNFGKDVTVKSITIDASKQYESKLISVPAIEIVEDEGVTNVKRMRISTKAKVTMDMEYTDGSIANQDIEIGDVLTDTVIMNGPGTEDTTGTFKIVAWYYKINKSLPEILGVYLKDVTNNKIKLVNSFKNFIRFTEEDAAEVDDPTSLSSITDALENSETGEVYAEIGVDVVIPERDDGKITTTMIGEGKTLNLNLNGHSITTKAYAFYVNGGTLNISDSTGHGTIVCTEGASKAYPAVYVNAGGTCNMDSGLIDTTQAEVPEGKENWLYGVVCANDGVFNMTGGKMKIKGASGISITNGTATGKGATFVIGGNAEITSTECAAVYLADNKSVTVKDNAVINGGMVLRMGDISIEDNAVINGHKDPSIVFPLGEQVVLSGVGAPSAAILALTGIYGSDLGNDLNINVAKTAKVKGYIDDGIDIATINTKFDQKVDINVEEAAAVSAPNNNYRVYTHDELAALAQAAGKNLGPETKATDLTIKIAGQKVYPEN